MQSAAAKKASMRKKQQRVLEDSFSSDEDNKKPVKNGIEGMKMDMDPNLFMSQMNLDGDDVMQSFSKIDFAQISKFRESYQLFYHFHSYFRKWGLGRKRRG